mgnify:CR=1 FL=1
MLTVGVIGAAFLGNIKDRQIDRDLSNQNIVLHEKVVGQEESSVFGKYKPINQAKLATLTPEEKGIVQRIIDTAKKNALMTVAIFPAIMLLCYLGLIFYFKTKGGYKAVELQQQE